jgi:hypothetical protein
MTEKDYALILIGLVFGIYASAISGRIFTFYNIKLEILKEIQLFSGFLCADSKDFTRIPRADRALELLSIQLMFLGHEQFNILCHSISDEMENIIDKVGKYRHPNYVDISILKTSWLQKIAKAKPSWGAIFLGKEPISTAIQKYSEKEKQYIEKAKKQIASYPGSIIPYENI